ncbi:MAG: c-type cytochrome [Sphingobacteriales bacterium]|jgi:cytochrome c|nr:c-type cytochrome [Sphingobacteriales bacterium]
MIKWFLFYLTFAILSACGSNDKSGSGDKVNFDAIESNPVYFKGHRLVERYQCETCHKVDEDLTGPAHSKVAKKYAGADESAKKGLAKKIIDGGSGVWGNVPMTPHPNVSEEDAKAMVDYILLLQ